MPQMLEHEPVIAYLLTAYRVASEQHYLTRDISLQVILRRSVVKKCATCVGGQDGPAGRLESGSQLPDNGPYLLKGTAD